MSLHNSLRNLFLVACLLLLVSSLKSQPIPFAQIGDDVDATYSLAFSAESQALFGPEAPIELELVLDMKSIFRKKSDESYEEGFLTIHTAQGAIERPIGVKARGEFRRSYCNIPPLSLKLKKANFGLAAWDDLSKIKLVTGCRQQDVFEQLLMKEYLAYKLYQTINPASFQVRLVHIIYKDVNQRYPDVAQMGFLLEDIDELAKRNDSFEMEPKQMLQSWAHRQGTLQLALFQYAIGNSDWHVGNLHNLKVIRSNDPMVTRPVLVPYDFDFAGLVDAPYAEPNPDLQIPSVKTRVYQGICFTESEFQAALQVFRDVQDEWFLLVDTCPHLSERSRHACKDYLEEFFRLLDSPHRIEVAFRSDCQ